MYVVDLIWDVINRIYHVINMETANATDIIQVGTAVKPINTIFYFV